MSYTIQYYSPEVQLQVLTLPDGLAGRYVTLTRRMLEEGSNLGEPYTQSMGKTGLFELRLKAKEGIARVMYCTLVGKQIVMLHSFVKKTQKTPKQDLDIALKRMKEVKNGNWQNHVNT